MMRNAKDFSCEEISSREAACRKGVSISTIRNWVRSGKISGYKLKNRYVIMVDESFHQAQRNQRNESRLREKVLEQEQKILELQCELRNAKALSQQFGLLYEQALGRAENAEAQLANYKIWELTLHHPEAVRNYFDHKYHNNYHSSHSQPQPESYLDKMSQLDKLSCLEKLSYLDKLPYRKIEKVSRPCPKPGNWLPPLEPEDNHEVTCELYEPEPALVICGETLELLEEHSKT